MNVLFVTAHPDDAELYAGGFICKYGKRCNINVLVVTDGRVGSEESTDDTVLMRRKEAEQASAYGNFRVDFLEYADGEVENDLKLRNAVIRKIRECKPSVIITHKDNDYHPDHRYVSKAVQDSLVAVYCPKYLPDTEAIDYIPLVLFLWNPFSLPYAFINDICIDITAEIDRKKELVLCHGSQFCEGAFLNSEVYGKGEEIYSSLYGNAAVNVGGLKQEKGYAEAFEICQYITPDQRRERLAELAELLR